MTDGTEFPATFEGLVELVRRLRGPEGCPWDREQTAESMKRYFLDECYELIDAIDQDDAARLTEELGDVLFHLAFQVQLGKEVGALTDEQPFGVAIEKLVRRHPHVFGDVEVADSREAWANWDTIKRREQADSDDSILESVPRSLPALSQAELIQERAARAGFDWEEVQGVVDKVSEEIDELRSAETGEAREAELGDILFSVVNVARWLGSDAESALRASNDRFRARFALMEKLSARRGEAFNSLTLDEKESLWREAKELLG